MFFLERSPALHEPMQDQWGYLPECQLLATCHPSRGLISKPHSEKLHPTFFSETCSLPEWPLAGIVSIVLSGDERVENWWILQPSSHRDVFCMHLHTDLLGSQFLQLGGEVPMERRHVLICSASSIPGLDHQESKPQPCWRHSLPPKRGPVLEGLSRHIPGDLSCSWEALW